MLDPGGARSEPPGEGDVVAARYELMHLLGRGGMGAVRAARDRVTGKPVAVKMLLPALCAVPELQARFQREAHAASALSHPNVVSVYDFGVLDGGGLYIVMELVTGRSLATLLGDGPMALARVHTVARQILEALAHAHAAGVVHRDLKPENIMLVDAGATGYGDGGDLVKLLDFGVAKLTEPGDGTGSRLTQAGIAFGTPDYMAPEQALGQAIDGRADLYAVGVLLFEMISGRLPFEAEEVSAMLRMHVALDPPRLSTIVPGISVPVEVLVARALEKRPAARFATAEEMIAALDDALEPSPPERAGLAT